MSAVTSGAYETWIASLDEREREVAIKAGLDRPPEDSNNIHRSHSGCEVREYDGLETFKKNGGVHPLVHESTRDHTDDDQEDFAETEVASDLAQALRRVLEFIVRGLGPLEAFKHSRTITQRVFCVARAVQIGGFEQPTLAEVAEAGGLSRASLSKISVELRDAFGNEHLHYGGRQQARETMRRSTTAAWRRRKG
jgi:hypothetical protein